jgi:hypothetical protein
MKHFFILIGFFFAGLHASASESVTLPIGLMPVTCTQTADYEDCNGPIEANSKVTVVLDNYTPGRTVKVWSGSKTLTVKSEVGPLAAEITIQKRFHEVFKTTSYTLKLEVFHQNDRPNTRIIMDVETSDPSVNSTLSQINSGRLSGVRMAVENRKIYPMVIIDPIK